ncbi:MAG: protease complex subunit PrcB family protein [Lachnospiraceae bacterium]
MKKWKLWGSIVVFVGFFVCLSLECGCDAADKEKKLRDLDYTVVAQEEIPQEIQEMIEEKKQTAFNLTKQMDDGMYLVRGYGRQKGNGYSVQVLECYLTKEAVYVKTELKGDDNSKNNGEKESFPYIVVKIEQQDKIVIFK